jgi:hypothetical protein
MNLYAIKMIKYYFYGKKADNQKVTRFVNHFYACNTLDCVALKRQRFTLHQAHQQRQQTVDTR